MNTFNNTIDNLSRTIDSREKYSPKDITVCVAIRATDINPWILSRLEFLLEYYEPRPEFMIVDFGSEEKYSAQIALICKKHNAEYLFINDMETFSAAKARNIGGKNIKTDLIFFTDIDFVYDRNIFRTLTDYSNKLELNSAKRRFLTMPIYHIGKETSQRFENIKNFQEKDIYLNTLGYLGQSTRFNQIFEFIAPYSNAFLITKEFFNLSGGYCDIFRGHGSEDFEFLIRLGVLSSNIPLPDSLNNDEYGPLGKSFFKIQNYSGFRKYLELLTLPAESLGLKAFHIWHEKPKEKGYWTAENDWKREKFNQIISHYYPNIDGILKVDFHPRNKKALCLYSDQKSWGYFLPLRSYDYTLEVCNGKNDEELYETINKIESKHYDRIFIFNPYMKSHSKFRGILELAKKNKIHITIIERGGLPNSIYYADEVVYGDKEYHKIDDVISHYDPVNLNFTENFINNIKAGKDVLETQESFKETWDKNYLLRSNSKLKIFLPLQLPDDMAVTKFTEDHIKYSEFLESIITAAKNNKDTIFIFKKHPLLKEEFILDDISENLIKIDDKANIHALIDICDATVVYNSGVGLLSCLHNKPTFNVGNVYYSTPTKLSNSVFDVCEAITLLKENNFHLTSKKDLLLFTDWLIFKKYSWFTAKSIIREFSTRKAHAYDNIMVEIINLDENIKNIGARYSDFEFSKISYLWWKSRVIENKKIDSTDKNKFTKHEAESDRLLNFYNIFLSERKAKKLKEKPMLFFKDSKNNLITKINKFIG